MGVTKRSRMLALAMVAGLALAACGGGDDDDAAEETTTTGEDTTTTKSTDSGDDLGDFTGECADFTEAFADAGQAISSAFSGSGDGDLEDVASYFDEVSERLPEEIRDDFEVFAGAYEEFALAIADADIDFSDPQSADPEALAELQELTSAFSSAEVQEASENIQAYMAESCGG